MPLFLKRIFVVICLCLGLSVQGANALGTAITQYYSDFDFAQYCGYSSWLTKPENEQEIRASIRFHSFYPTTYVGGDFIFGGGQTEGPRCNSFSEITPEQALEQCGLENFVVISEDGINEPFSEDAYFGVIFEATETITRIRYRYEFALVGATNTKGVFTKTIIVPRDTTEPLLTVEDDVLFFDAHPSGFALVNLLEELEYQIIDDVDLSITPNFTLADGTAIDSTHRFSVGDHEVLIWATDSDGNSTAKQEVLVRVFDVIPEVVGPDNLTIYASPTNTVDIGGEIRVRYNTNPISYSFNDYDPYSAPTWNIADPYFFYRDVINTDYDKYGRDPLKTVENDQSEFTMELQNGKRLAKQYLFPLGETKVIIRGKNAIGTSVAPKTVTITVEGQENAPQKSPILFSEVYEVIDGQVSYGFRDDDKAILLYGYFEGNVTTVSVDDFEVTNGYVSDAFTDTIYSDEVTYSNFSVIIRPQGPEDVSVRVKDGAFTDFLGQPSAPAEPLILKYFGEGNFEPTSDPLFVGTSTMIYELTEENVVTTAGVDKARVPLNRAYSPGAKEDNSPFDFFVADPRYVTVEHKTSPQRSDFYDEQASIKFELQNGTPIPDTYDLPVGATVISVVGYDRNGVSVGSFTVRYTVRDNRGVENSDDSDPLIVAETQDAIIAFQAARANQVLTNQTDLTSFLTGGRSNRARLSFVGGQGNVDIQTNGRVWTQITGSISDAGTTDQSFFLATVGSHKAVSENLLIGAMAQFDRFESSNSDNSVSGNGWLIGPYVVAKHATQPLYFEGRALIGATDNKISPFNTYTDSFKTQRHLIKAKLSGEIEMGTLTLIPNASVAYTKDRQKQYTDSLSNVIPEQSVSIMQGSAGLAFRKDMQAQNGNLTLSGGVSAIFSETSTQGGTGNVVPDYEGERAKIELQLDYENQQGLSYAIGGYLDGIGASGYQTIGLKAGLSFDF